MLGLAGGAGWTCCCARVARSTMRTDGELVIMTFNACGGLASLATAACELLCVQAAMSSKLGQILSWGRVRGAHIITPASCSACGLPCRPSLTRS